MGFFSAIKKIFVGESVDDAELDAARARHGVQLSARDKIEADTPVTEEERFAQDYDVWEDLKRLRTSFYLGSWAAKKFHVIGEDKVKKQLDELEQKREAEKRKKGAKG